MNLTDLVNNLLVDTKGVAAGTEITADSSIGAFLPELTICATIVAMLLIRVFNLGRRADAFYIALIGSALALVFCSPWTYLTGAIAADNPASAARMEIFTGMLVFDGLTVFARTVLLGFAVLFVVFTKLSGIPDREDGPDIYCLVLGSTLGLCLMASANHLIMVFMAVEMASVPSYVMAGMLKGRRKSSEAALKYSIYGAGAAGVMLYGISLLAGMLNTVHLPSMAVALAEKINSTIPGEEVMVLVLGGLLVAVGLAFKLSAVPFHFWAPDVFEGASAEVGAFLSIASKAAALVLLVRVAIGFGAVPAEGYTPGQRTAMIAGQDAVVDSKAHTTPAIAVIPDTQQEANAAPVDESFVALLDHDTAEDTTAEEDSPESKTGAKTDNKEKSQAPLTRDQQNKLLSPVRSFMAKLIAFFAIITCTFGNLAAYGQTNIKRLMAYSTIAHAGYMMMPVPAMLALAAVSPESANTAIAGLCIYLAVYLFMNLGAFAIIAFLRNEMRSEEIADYGGLIHRAPTITICFVILLFSLVGLPPLAGFVGKFAIFASLVDAYKQTSHNYLMITLVAGGLNTAISLFYYLRLAKVMTIDPQPEDRPPFRLSGVSLQGVFVAASAVLMIGLFLFWNGLSELAQAAASGLLS